MSARCLLVDLFGNHHSKALNERVSPDRHERVCVAVVSSGQRRQRPRLERSTSISPIPCARGNLFSLAWCLVIVDKLPRRLPFGVEMRSSSELAIRVWVRDHSQVAAVVDGVDIELNRSDDARTKASHQGGRGAAMGSDFRTIRGFIRIPRHAASPTGLMGYQK
jgi:hypothetical protein